MSARLSIQILFCGQLQGPWTFNHIELTQAGEVKLTSMYSGNLKAGMFQKKFPCRSLTWQALHVCLSAMLLGSAALS